MGHVHFLSLAVSDLLLAFWFVHGAVWKVVLLHQYSMFQNEQESVNHSVHPELNSSSHWEQNSTDFSLDTPSFRLYYELWFASGGISTWVNRCLTLYITVERLRCVCSVKVATEVLRRETKEHVRETLLKGVLPGGGWLTGCV